MTMAGLSKAERIAVLRTKMRHLGADIVEFPTASESPSATGVAAPALAAANSTTALPVPADMRGVFNAPGMPGGLPTGSVSTIDHPGFIQAALIAEVTRNHKHVAIVNEPELSLATIVELGGDLSRIAVVPNAGDSPLDIAAILAEGVDLITGRLPEVTMTRARPLDARLRSHDTTMLLVDGNWPSTQLQIRSELADLGGLGIGHGRIRHLEWDIHLRAKSGLQAHTRWYPGHGDTELADFGHNAPEQRPPLQLAR